MIKATRAARSIRVRLALWNLAVLALVLLATLGTAALSARAAARSAVDEDLRKTATRIASHIEHERREHRERPRRTPEHEEETEEGVVEQRAEIVLVADASGVIVRADGGNVPAGLPDKKAIEAALAGGSVFSDLEIEGAPMRAFTVPVGGDKRDKRAVQVAKPTAESRAAVGRTVLILGITGAIGLVLSALGSLFLAGRAMRPIEQAMTRQQRFIADASHELRTPVAVIRARAELLATSPEEVGQEARAELEQLSKDAAELSNLLGVLLDLARLDAAADALELSPTPIGDVAEEVALQLAPLAREVGASIEARGAPVFAKANLTRLRQVVRALADNALKHAGDRGTVTIQVDEVQGRARLRVRDDGPGIAPEHLPNVKERFYRADEARSRSDAPARGNRGGVGLGLAIAAELVERMRGELSIESELGKGTTVTVLLPLA